MNSPLHFNAAPQSTDQGADTNSVAYLRSPAGIRQQSRLLLEHIRAGSSEYFKFDRDKFDALVPSIVEFAQLRHRSVAEVPAHTQWRHFLKSSIPLTFSSDPLENARAKIDLLVVSETVDVGGLKDWRYTIRASSMALTRTEGLAAAVSQALKSGFFGNTAAPRADVGRLSALTVRELEDAFQVSKANPIEGGIDLRLERLKTLADSVNRRPAFFDTSGQARPGNFIDHLISQSSGGSIKADTVLSAVLDAFQDIWPGELQILDQKLGDTWRHSSIKTDNKLIPIHRMASWFTYSLIEVIEDLGIKVKDKEQLPGLAGYRNAGLLVDSRVLVPKAQDLESKIWNLGDDPIIELRSATIALIDELAETIRRSTRTSNFSLPQLHGLMWHMGRGLADQKRSGGNPPIQAVSPRVPF